MYNPLTTTELKSLGIHANLARRWFDTLEEAGLARRASGRKYGLLLFSPLAKDFLLHRRGKSGNPAWTLGRTISHEEILNEWLGSERHDGRDHSTVE